MNGLELSKKYYEAFGRPALETHAPKLLPKLAAGLVGEGSECLGFDDEISRDHDFDPGFCLWLTRADYEAHGFALERLYAKLPKEFEGLSFKDARYMYDGFEHSIVVEGAPKEATITYSSPNTQTEEGIYVITATVSSEGYDLTLKALISF